MRKCSDQTQDSQPTLGNKIRGAALFVLLATAFVWPSGARAQEASPAGGNTLVVSTPAAGLSANPGYTLHTWIRVGNNGDRPLHATVTLASLSFGDNGEVRIDDSPDGFWADRVHIAAPDLSMPARTYQDDPIDVSVPESFKPDTYFVGFLVTPTPEPGSVRVINRVGTFIAFDLPGERQRVVRIENIRVPHFVFGTHVPIKFAVRNTGPSFAMTWSELHVGSWTTHEKFHAFLQRQRVPSGHTRDYAWTASMPFNFGFVHIRTLAFYNRTDQQIAQSQITANVFVIDPRYALIVLLLIGVVAIWYVRRRRSRTPHLRVVDLSRDIKEQTTHQRPAAIAH